MDTNEAPPFSAPPPLSPPPVIVPPTPPPPPRRSRGWMILAIVLLVFLAISLLGNFGQFVSGVVPVASVRTRTAGPKLDEVLMEDNDADKKIAVVDVDGIISSSAAD